MIIAQVWPLRTVAINEGLLDLKQEAYQDLDIQPRYPLQVGNDLGVDLEHEAVWPLRMGLCCNDFPSALGQFVAQTTTTYTTK